MQMQPVDMVNDFFGTQVSPKALLGYKTMLKHQAGLTAVRMIGRSGNKRVAIQINAATKAVAVVHIAVASAPRKPLRVVNAKYILNMLLRAVHSGRNVGRT